MRTRFALILYFRMVAHKAACHTLSKAFLESMKTWYRICWCWRYFSHRILRLKICSVVLLPALNPACSSAIISSAWGLSLFKITFKVLEACYSAQLLSFYLYLSLDAIGTVCHQFGLLCTDLHLIPCAGFVETFY